MKPMLAASITLSDLHALRYPVLVSEKLDGIRCLIVDGQAVSRALKPIPNRYINSILSKKHFNGLDGELIVGNTFQETTSAVMSVDGEPDFTFHVFDDYELGRHPFNHRLQEIETGSARVKVIRHFYCIEPEDILIVYHQSKEGVIIRDYAATYKSGRSTIKEQGMLKLKKFIDAEAVVIGIEEEHDISGNPKGTLGALVVLNNLTGVIFKIGTGFTSKDRTELFNPATMGKVVKFSYLDCGTKDRPRHPVFLGIRNEIDI